MAGNGDSGISRGAVSRAMALHQMRNELIREYFEERIDTSNYDIDFSKLPESSKKIAGF